MKGFELNFPGAGSLILNSIEDCFEILLMWNEEP
jgi:hypothetical protein